MYPRFEMLDLRTIAPELIRLIIEAYCLQFEEQDSFWMVHDHDPIELYDFLQELGFTVQTHIYTKDEYRIFMGKI